jgi:hypothetical protein
MENSFNFRAAEVFLELHTKAIMNGQKNPAENHDVKGLL